MLENKELVSVVVISYNHASFVEECLNSVINQTYFNWELIIADDASKDNSVEIINKWIKNKGLDIKTNFHSFNTGVATILNECIDLCRGTFIKFIAADDVLAPSLLSKAIEVFNQDNSELGVVFTNAQFINEFSEIQKKTIIQSGQNIPTGWVRNHLINNNFIPAPSVLIRKSVYQTIGYYNPEVKTDDYDCWLRASLYFRFQYIDECLVFYRIHQNNVSHSLDFASERINLLIKNDDNGSFSSGIKKAIMDQYYIQNLGKNIVAQYRTYKYKDKWLSFSIANKIPYKIFRLIDKVIASSN